MMTSHMCSVIKHSAPWIGAIAVLLTFASFFCYIVLFLFFTSLLLILSTSILFTISKKNKIVVKKPVQNNEIVISSSDSNNQPKEAEPNIVAQLVSTMPLQNKQECQEDEKYSSDSDPDLPYNCRGGAMSQDYLSDGSISDEESLIEIALPSGQYVSSPIYSLPSFSAEAMFKQHAGLMELLAEFNEENFIEIDITMGSIKCSRFEIEA